MSHTGQTIFQRQFDTVKSCFNQISFELKVSEWLISKSEKKEKMQTFQPVAHITG